MIERSIIPARVPIVVLLLAAIACSDQHMNGPDLPNPPTDLTAAIDQTNHVSLSWSPRPNNENIVAYSVYRDGFRIGETANASFIDSIAPGELTHTYNVASHSSEGVVSRLSSPVAILAPDAVRPFVLTVTPADGAINVAGGAPIQVRFSERMDATSIVAEAFDIRDATTGTRLTGAVAYDTTTRTATWTPAPPLPAERRITLTVAPSVTDLRGNRMASAFSESFTTRESSLPFIVSYYPQSGATIPAGTWPTVQFSERLQTNFFGATAGVRLLDPALGAAGLVSGTSPFDTLTNTVTVLPGKRIQSLRRYRVEVNQSAIDLAGNPIAERFEYDVFFGEWTLPGVASVSPADGATGVPLSGNVIVDLTDPILPFNDYDLRLSVVSQNTNNSVGFATIYGLFNNRISLLYSNAAPNTTYIATFRHFFTDSKGVLHELTKQWKFTTQP